MEKTPSKSHQSAVQATRAFASIRSFSTRRTSHVGYVAAFAFAYRPIFRSIGVA
jgi:hypothetical protein